MSEDSSEVLDAETYLVRVPGSGSGSSLGFSITNDGNGDHVGLVHDTSVGDSKTVTKLTTLVDSSWGLGVSAHALWDSG